MIRSSSSSPILTTSSGLLIGSAESSSSGIKPVITLKNDTLLYGQGTENEPFYVSGTYSETIDKYQDEKMKLNSQLIEIESKLTQENKTEAHIETFKQIARKYIDFDELTPEIINNLISHITVNHVKVINGTKFKEIKIIYMFIG